MNKKNKKIYILCGVLIVVLLIFFSFLFNINNKKQKNSVEEISTKILEVENLANNNIEELENGVIGILEIPKINLIGKIHEGTEEDIINKYIGHFENTNLWSGNIGLCAHNSRL